uniref:Uncharacterized protein n=1 Tax=Lessardia elongata TaxID=210733 RepID=A0A7S2VW22_9DINO
MQPCVATSSNISKFYTLCLAKGIKQTYKHHWNKQLSLAKSSSTTMACILCDCTLAIARLIRCCPGVWTQREHRLWCDNNRYHTTHSRCPSLVGTAPRHNNRATSTPLRSNRGLVTSKDRVHKNMGNILQPESRHNNRTYLRLSSMGRNTATLCKNTQSNNMQCMATCSASWPSIHLLMSSLDGRTFEKCL